MSGTFRIQKDYWNDGIEIFEKATISFKPGFTTLVGCNGAGKTTVLKHLKQKLDTSQIRHVDFDNVTEGGSRAIENAGYLGDMEFLMSGLISSEGENIVMNLQRIGGSIARAVNSCMADGKTELWVLLDAVDSGLSIDNVRELKSLFRTVMKDCRKRGIALYIIASANEYELVRGSMAYDVISGKYVDVPTYDDYCSLIMESAKKKKHRGRHARKTAGKKKKK